MLSTDKAWEKFGREDPYYGVLASDRFAADKIVENRDEFFASGRHSVSQIIKRYEDHFGPLPRNRALDHGCGVGRLTFPFAHEFSDVLGLDVSQSMLAEANSNATKFGVSNAQFALADDTLANAPGRFDFVNSFMVLQHIRVGRGLRILERLLERVEPGGGAHLHFAIRTDRLRSRALWWASHHIPGVKIWQNIFAKRAWNAPAMQMNDYPVSRIVVLLARHGIADCFVSTERHGQFLTCSVIGKKAARP